jgi:hypothetical protein
MVWNKVKDFLNFCFFLLVFIIIWVLITPFILINCFSKVFEKWLRLMK